MRRWVCPVWLALLTAFVSAAHAAVDPVRIGDGAEVRSHVVGDVPVVRVPWRDLTLRWVDEQFEVDVVVDATGRVVRAQSRTGPPTGRAAAVKAAQATRFQPFLREGKAVPARFALSLPATTEDYAGPADRSFPLDAPPDDIRISLRRTACYGTCPVYRVEVRGDGQVTYEGEADVLVLGEQHWRIPPDAVARLLQTLRQADYFRLAGEYVVAVTDNPTYATQASIGPKRKVVLDYAGAMSFRAGEGIAATLQSGGQMPRSVTQVEEAIDELSGVHGMTQGDASTLTRLREQGWRFQSAASGQAVAFLVRRCNVALARDFILAGSPVDGQMVGMGGGDTLALAARCGDRGLVRLLVSKGAIAGKTAASSFLESSTDSGYPEFVQLALEHGARVASSSPRRGTLIGRASDAAEPRGDAHGDATYDPARVISLLKAAGANPNELDRRGDTPLHQVTRAAVARALLQAGGDANARNAQRQTPLFNRYGNVEIASLLLSAGADVDAHDDRGLTALEVVEDEGIALLLLDAGATLPADPSRLAALRARAAAGQWHTLLTRMAPSTPPAR